MKVASCDEPTRSSPLGACRRNSRAVPDTVAPSIPHKIFPDIEFGIVTIDVPYSGAAPEEVEEALRSHYPSAYAWARAVPALRAGDLAPQTLVPAMGHAGDLPGWWNSAVVGEGPVIPPEAPELE